MCIGLLACSKLTQLVTDSYGSTDSEDVLWICRCNSPTKKPGGPIKINKNVRQQVRQTAVPELCISPQQLFSCYDAVANVPCAVGPTPSCLDGVGLQHRGVQGEWVLCYTAPLLRSTDVWEYLYKYALLRLKKPSGTC